MPPKGYKKGQPWPSPKVTGPAPAPKEKAEKNGPKMRAKMAEAQPHYDEPKKRLSESYSRISELYSEEKIRVLTNALSAFAQAVGAPNLSADAYAAINEEIEDTVHALSLLREQLVGPTTTVTQEVTIQQPAQVAPKAQKAVPMQAAPPPPPLPFPTPGGFQQAPLPSFAPVPR